MQPIRIVLAAALLLLGLDALPATKVDEGMTTGPTRDGRSLKRVSRAFTEDPVYYFIYMKDHKPGPSSTRCVIKGPKGDILVDETEQFEDDDTEFYLTCGVDGDEKELDAGTYTFTQYLNGELVGERAIPVESKPWFHLSLRKQFKWALGALAGVILAIFWVRKKIWGDKTIDKAFPSKEGAVLAEARAAAGGGSAGTGVFMKDPAPPPKPAEPTPDDLYKKFKAVLAVDANAKPMRPEDVLPIVKSARAAGDSKTAIAAVRGFDKVNPGHALIPDVYLMSAKIMAEDLKNFDMARKVLEHMIAKYPGHYLANEARRDLKALPA
ncbi:MAG TPA: hypothetical protein VLL50_02235 [Usitatibacter sp.]|nr:hypothetical protein [Usitatibacter sp.]